MKGKKVDTDFLSRFISESIQSGLQTPEEISGRAQEMVKEIDEEIKKVEQRKVIRSKLLDVIATFSVTKPSTKSEEARILSFFKIQNVNICQEICHRVKSSVTTIDELSKMSYSVPDILFSVKQLLEHKILSKSGSHLLRGEMFDEYLKFVLKEV